MNAFALAAAPNGARKTQADHPAVPLTPREIAQCAIAARDAGACMFHLHVRGADGRHSLELAEYRRAVEAIRASVGSDLVIQPTTESAGIYAPEQQIALVRALAPETTSLALREVFPDATSESGAAAFFAWAYDARVIPQLILYDVADVRRYIYLRERDTIAPDRHWAIFVLGRYAEERAAQPGDLLPFLDAWKARGDLTADVPWMACAFGQNERACVARAVELGGHARIGFENNVRRADGSTAPDNAALLSEFVQAEALRGNHPIAAQQLRELLARCGEAPYRSIVRMPDAT